MAGVVDPRFSALCGDASKWLEAAPDYDAIIAKVGAADGAGVLAKSACMTALTSLEMDVHVDSDFMGLYGTEKKDDPDSVRSRTGYVIRVNKCPIVWCSKLEHSITTSTMMAEYYALSTAMREVLPLRDLVSTVAKGLGFDSECQTTFKTKVCEDNMGCLTLAQLEPGHNTPRSRFYDNKVHWFRQHVYDSNGRITVERCDTKNMIADTFTKACVRDTFEYLRKLLMGW